MSLTTVLTDRFLAPVTLLGLLTVTCCAFGCDGNTGTHIGNPPQGHMGFTARISTSTVGSTQKPLLLDDAGTVYTLHEAMVRIDEVRLLLPKGTRCDTLMTELDPGLACADAQGELDMSALTLPGPFELELVSGTASTDLTQLQIPALDYAGAVIDLADDEGGEEAEDTLSLDFELEYEAETIRLQLSLEPHGAIDAAVVTTSTPDALLLEVDPSHWLENVDLVMCLELELASVEDGEVDLESEEGGDDTCADIPERIAENLDAEAGD